MNSVIKRCAFFVLFFSFFVANAQNDFKIEEESISKEFDALKGYTTFSLGFPLFFGDQFLSKGYSIKSPSFNVDFNFTIYKRFYIGLGFDYTSLTVERPELVSPVDRSDLIHYRVNGGYYLVSTKKFLVDASLGIAVSRIRNAKGNVNFYDGGWGISADINAGYNLAKQLNVFVSVSQQADFFNIDTSAELKDFFSKAYALTPSLGIRLVFK
ncbi:hypothetical protein [Galbibacter mesophilus]|uniref:hypothetical protein n=1 Tax=Galbibacter mesophilus TaxID=379069 RepID=UPI00191CE8C4|nr:hypothetical protein [Galbibacter mesophilus]MCM5662233.1 hypothetical protein [Galbibacter mesophilus]